MLHQRIIQELQDIPEENLDALYEMIHLFRLSLQKEQPQPRTPGLLTGKLNSSLFEPYQKRNSKHGNELPHRHSHLTVVAL